MSITQSSERSDYSDIIERVVTWEWNSQDKALFRLIQSSGVQVSDGLRDILLDKNVNIPHH